MNVSTILKSKGSDVITRGPEVTLGDITRILDEKKIGSVVIVDEHGKVCGMVSERDIVMAIARKTASVLDQPVSFCMSKNVFTCSKSDSLEKLMSEMTMRRFRHIPVVEQGQLVGLVSIGDVVKQRIAETEMEAASMRQYIATG